MSGVCGTVVVLVVALAIGTSNANAPPPFVALPTLGWSTWNTFRESINDTLVRESAYQMANGPLRGAGYRYILLDDGWAACKHFSPIGECVEEAGRDAEGRILVDTVKFPHGFKSLTDYVHSLGLLIGIYTSVSAQTCGGFTGSLNHERVDAKSFADWGFDFVKHDTCGTDCGVHDGCIQHAAYEMAMGLNSTGREIVYYLDNGNPTSPQRVYNPHNHHVMYEEAIIKVATRPEELVWYWSTQLDPSIGPHLTKSWFDRKDTWISMLTNLHNQVRVAEYQSCGRFNMPDMLTVGMGAQSQGQYRAQFFLWAVLGAPLILGNDIRKMDQFTVDLLTAPEVLAVDQDPECVQGSMSRSLGSWESWIKPLHDGDFAVVLLNKGENPTNATVHISRDYNWGDFYPAFWGGAAYVRDIYHQINLGMFNDTFTAEIPALDAHIYRFTPIPSPQK